jgi:pimeloyl-ACP methyl ester carboxylesterase
MSETSERPRLLLVPLLTEIEWLIKPELEEWAEVASFDAPGVGDEPPAETFDRYAIARRGLDELDRRGWDSCVVVADGSAIATALRLARARPESVEALALGHARLSDDTEGERAPRNGEIIEAVGQLLRVDYGNFVRYGLVQATHGSIGDELARQMLERVPEDIGKAAWEIAAQESERFEPILRGLDVPLLLAKHEGCLGNTDEGFEDAVAAFPRAQTVSVPEAPSVSAEFATALRSFVMSLTEAPSGIR